MIKIILSCLLLLVTLAACDAATHRLKLLDYDYTPSKNADDV